MITQKPISARIKHETMWKLDMERQVSGQSVNALLNDGAVLICDVKDTRRELLIYHGNDYVKEKIITGFLKKWLPEYF